MAPAPTDVTRPRAQTAAARWLIVVAMAHLFLGSPIYGQLADAPRQDFWVPDGFVFATVVTNGVVYIGGDFKSVSPNGGRGTLLNIFSGESNPLLPQVNGAILSVAPDGAGGWFVGGEFTAIAGLPRTNLAHIRADLTVDPAWAPNAFGFTSVTQRSRIFALARTEQALFVGGIFTNISGQARSSVAAIDPLTGAALPWTANIRGEVYVVSVRENRLYLGGTFDSVAGFGRTHLAAVDVNTGAVLPWNPVVTSSFGPSVTAFALSADTLYVGGDYEQVNGFERRSLAAFDLASDQLLPWNPGAEGAVHALQVDCDNVYAGGSFTNLGGLARNRIGALNTQTGQATDWNPDADESVFALAIVGKTAFAGGWFTAIGGIPRNSVAAIDLDSGQVKPWTARADRVVLALAVAGNHIFAGGGASAGGVPRNNLAAFDEVTGEPLPWNPGTDGPVYALAVSSNAVYAGGGFSTLGGQPRSNLGAVSPLSGATLSWQGNVSISSGSAEVYALALRTNALYAGGFFNTANGALRVGAAAFDRITGAVLPWAPSFDRAPQAMVASGTGLFVGGYFTSVSGRQRNHIAEIDAFTGVPTSWSNSLNDVVFALATDGATVYAGGLFFIAGSSIRVGAAAFNRNTAAVTPWNPQLTPFSGDFLWPFGSIALASNVIYIGGSFNAVGGLPRQGLAAVDRVTGAPTSFDPGLGDYRAAAFAIAVSDQRLYTGGAFVTVGDRVQPFLAAFVQTGFPRVVSQPVPLVISPGENATFQVSANGQAPLTYQWQLHGTNLPGATNTQVTIAAAQPPASGPYRVVVSNAVGRSTSFEALLTVAEPVAIVEHPQSQLVVPNDDITLTVVATGSPPPAYQWRRNGVNIPGAIYSTLRLLAVQPTDGGTYTVVVANLGGAVTSDRAIVRVDGPSLPFADNFAERSSFADPFGFGGGSNILKTVEPNEPRHAGKVGGNSVWISWIAPDRGVATFSTRGSSFDTLLAVYTNAALPTLSFLAGDEDRAGFANSEVSFNAEPGVEYILAIDGLGGASGNIMLSWSLDTATVPFPRIIHQPQSVTVNKGVTVTFEVDVLRPNQSHEGEDLRWQWFHGCRLLPGETNRFLTNINVTASHVGGYRCMIKNDSSHVAESAEALLEIGPVLDVVSQDKLEDVISAISSPPPSPYALRAAASSASIVNVAMGSVTPSQLFDTTGSSTSANEPNHCAVLGGASKWFAVHPLESATMIVDTIGSSIDTVLAVYVGPDPLNMAVVACDDNGAPDRIRSFARFEATNTTNYWVVVDGVNGAVGNIRLNWQLGRQPTVVPMPVPPTPRLGQNYTLSVAATNSVPPPTFQWYFNGRAILGGTNETLHIENIQAVHAGVYSVVVENLAGAVTNSFGFIEVALPVTVTPALISSNGQRYLRLTGAPARKYIVEGANNLLEPWLPLYTNNAVADAPIEFLDHRPATNSFQYYRIVPRP